MRGKNIGYERLREEYVPTDWEFCDDTVVNILYDLPEDARKMLICIVEKGIRGTAPEFNTSKSDMGRKWQALKNRIRQNHSK